MHEQLWQKYQMDRSTFNRNKLVEANLLLVRDVIAKRFGGFANEASDLYQVGVIGLIKAVQRFDLNLGNKFSSYAVVVIDGEIRHHFRDKRDIVRCPRGIKPDSTVSLNQLVLFLGEHREWIDVLEDRTNESEDWGHLAEVIKLLPDEQGMVIELHFIDQLNRRQAAEKLGISPMTVTRRINAGLEKLRGILSAS